MEKYILPDGRVIGFDEKKGRIDFTPLEDYVGTLCDYYLDGEYRWTRPLQKVDYVSGEESGRPNMKKLKALFFTTKDE